MNSQIVVNKSRNVKESQEVQNVQKVKEVREVNVNEVVFREDLYPRIEKNSFTVQKYAEDLEVLPPIELNQRLELIDGWHRWTAHKKAEAKTIKAIITNTSSDTDFL